MRKNLLCVVAAGLAGYFIGFYEMKYKMIKLLLQCRVENDEKQAKNNEEQTES